MYNLILKDILIQKKMILLGFAYVIFFVFAMQGAGLVMYPMSLTALAYMLVITSCAYDEKNKADMLLNSLPLKRSTIVLAKYVSIFVYIMIGTLAFLVITVLISLTGLPLEIYPVSLEGLAGGLFAISLINSIYLPFYFKFGYMKSRFLNLILFFTFFFGLTGAVKFLYQNRDITWVQNMASFLQSLKDIEIFALIAGISAILLAVSFALALKFYQGRDL